MPTLFITHPACLDHLTPPGHPERPDRLRAINEVLGGKEFSALRRAEAPAASLENLALCHPMEYIEAIRAVTPQQGHGADRRRYKHVSRQLRGGAARHRRRALCGG